MPDLHIWIAFVLAAEALLILPGPTDMVVVSYALTQGKRSAWASVPGVTLGDATALILSLLGLGAILMASAELFNILKIAGALYWSISESRPGARRCRRRSTARRCSMGAGASWRIPTWRPRSIPAGSCFYVAFFPQFLSAEKPLLTQVAVFGATFIVMGTLNSILYATLALQVRRLVRSYRARKNMNRATGGFLIAMGGLVGLAKRVAEGESGCLTSTPWAPSSPPRSCCW
jgi:threonine/homoserine/homoserine lactone efflux protein